MSVIHPFVSSEMKWTVQQSWKPPWDCSCWFNVSCVHRGVTKGAQFPRRRKVLAISQVLSSTAELLPKDFRFEHVGAKLICCPGRHLTLLRPCVYSAWSTNGLFIFGVLANYTTHLPGPRICCYVSNHAHKIKQLY